MANKKKTMGLSRRGAMSAAGVAAASVVFSKGGEASAAHHEKEGHDHGPSHAVCVIRPTKGNKARGAVTFAQTAKGVKITARVSGLSAGKKHAIHIHELGDIRKPDGTGTGGHFNPEGHEHGLPDKKDKRHAGDLGNLTADAEGKAVYSLTVTNISIAGKNAILGRSIIVHAGEDTGAQPTGAAGARIAQGVIGIAAAPAKGGKKKGKKKAASAASAEPINAVCPISGKKANPEKFVMYKGEKVALCCGSCQKKFAASPEKFAANIKKK